MADLLARQARLKYLNAAKEGKYKLACRSQETRETELLRQQEKLQTLQVIRTTLVCDGLYWQMIELLHETNTCTLLLWYQSTC